MGVFSLLVACGLGLPLPEDIALITGGFLAAMGPPHGVGSVWMMMVVGLLGILVGDSIIFKAGKDYGDALLDTRLGRHIPRERVVQVREQFAKRGPIVIAIARFIPGIRAVTYFVAGSSKVPYYVFVLCDGTAALFSAPAWVWLGYWMGKKHAIRRAYAYAKEFQLILLAVIAAATLITVVVMLVRKRQAAAKAGAVAAPPTLEGGLVPGGAHKNGKTGVQLPTTPVP